MKVKTKHATNATLKLSINRDEVLALLRIMPAIQHNELSRSDIEFIAKLFHELKEFKSAMEFNDTLDEIFNSSDNKSGRIKMDTTTNKGCLNIEFSELELAELHWLLWILEDEVNVNSFPLIGRLSLLIKDYQEKHKVDLVDSYRMNFKN